MLKKPAPKYFQKFLKMSFCFCIFVFILFLKILFPEEKRENVWKNFDMAIFYIVILMNISLKHERKKLHRFLGFWSNGRRILPGGSRTGQLFGEYEGRGLWHETLGRWKSLGLEGQLWLGLKRNVSFACYKKCSRKLPSVFHKNHSEYTLHFHKNCGTILIWWNFYK